MSIVSSLNTGRMGFEASFHSTRPSIDTTVTWAAPDGPITWTQSRYSVLYLCAIELGHEDAEAARMARSGMVVWANESGYGGHEYRWNGWVCHPYAGVDKMVFSAGDPELAAFPNIEASVRKWWAVALEDPMVLGKFVAGDPLAAVALTRTSFGGGNVMPEDDARSIYTRISTYLSAPEPGAGPAPATPRARSSSGGKWLLAGAALALVLASGKKG